MLCFLFLWPILDILESHCFCCSVFWLAFFNVYNCLLIYLILFSISSLFLIYSSVHNLSYYSIPSIFIWNCWASSFTNPLRKILLWPGHNSIRKYKWSQIYYWYKKIATKYKSAKNISFPKKRSQGSCIKIKNTGNISIISVTISVNWECRNIFLL